MKILAGIVLFEPDIDRLNKNLDAIAAQVDCVLLVNNGSKDVITFLKKKRCNVNIHVINNEKNYGIAAALNQMLEYAQANDFAWLISLDQDSIAPANMVQEYKRIIEQENNIGILCPQICDINSQESEYLKTNIELICDEEKVITSGSCINVKAAINTGGFDERLFIDFVDTEFQKRLLCDEYKIVKDNAVILTHEVGKIRTINFMWNKIVCTNHNSIRRYYQVRNRLYFKKKYYGNVGLIKEKIRLIMGTFKIVLFEEDKKKKIIATKNGFKDYKRLLNEEIVSRVKKRKKISFVLPALYGTGGINVVYEYADRLSKRGHDITVYVPINAYNMHRGNICLDSLKQIYATFKVFKMVFIDKIPKKLEEEKKFKIKAVWKITDKFLENADIVIATAWCTAFDVNRLNQSKGKKFYFVQDYEVWDNLEFGKRSYQLPLIKITIAEWIKEKLVMECGCEKRKITIINNGIDTKKFLINRQEDKIDDKTIKCLMLDHNLEKKGVKYGVEAFNMAKEVIPELKLSMFGIKKSPYAPKNVDYYENPKQDVLVKLYQESDIFIFPSLEEGWGLTPIEAMACGCAVVGTNVGCMLDIGVNNENVILCESANSKQLADGIIKLSKNREFRKEIVEKGYKTIQKLDWEKSTEKFEQELLKYLKV